MGECRCRELESRCVELEAEIAKKKSDHKALEVKFRALEVEKTAVEEELKFLKREKDRFVDLTEDAEDKKDVEEGDTVVQLMIENSVLDCEKRRAESEVEFLKRKLMDLESKFEGTPYNNTPSKHIACTKGSVNVELKMEHSRRVRKHLMFEEDRSSSNKMAPTTPCSARTASLGVIDIFDSDDENVKQPSASNQGCGNVLISSDQALKKCEGSEKGMTSKGSSKIVFPHSCEENMNNCNSGIPCIPTPKRKRASNIVRSDSEDEDDNVPICKLRRIHLQEIISDQASPELKICSETGTLHGDDDISNLVTPPRRRLMSLRKREGQMGTEKDSSSKATETKRQPGIPTIEDNEPEAVESDSEGESLNGFIVDSTDVCDDDDSTDTEGESDENVDFDEILSRIKRNKDQKLAWEFEADMLAAFGKDPELCMKAVCALYRQQTSEEKVSKGTLVNNFRGFNKFDAHRGSTLAQFLTNEDPECDLKKSVKELLDCDPKGVEKCRTLATRYSKQLFEIYKSKEDPLFLPS